MPGKKALASLVAVGLIALAVAAPASARVPQGKGLVDLGTFQCEGSLGTISVYGPAGGPRGFTTSGLHVIVRSLSGSFGGETFSKTFGKKAGLGPFVTCTQGSLTGDFITVSGALLPPPRS
jgi:hypothetical protein